MKIPALHVVFSFSSLHGIYCLADERQLDLVDRSLSVGDVVKQQLSDSQSGTVVSTSISCTLQPCLATQARDFLSSCMRPEGIFGNTNIRVDPLSFQVPAQELRYCHRFAENDFIVYQDWVGRVDSVEHEVTIYLSDGSVVVIENPSELEETPMVPGTQGYALMKCLEQAGYTRCEFNRIEKRDSRTHVNPAYPYYPGQVVDIALGSLSRGHWKIGRFDPIVRPRGLVIDVQCKNLEISWCFPNLFKGTNEPLKLPPTLLDTSAIDQGTIKVYDRSKLPQLPSADPRPGASLGQDFGLGLHVRFKDPVSALEKYHGQTDGDIHLTPMNSTVAYDMNVHRVSQMITTVEIQWQDLSRTSQRSNSLVPVLSGDEHDVWPGELVSSKADEKVFHTEEEGYVLAKHVGIVQSVNATDRIAYVRWFEDAVFLIAGRDRSDLMSISIGSCSKNFSRVSLYEISAHPAFERKRGNRVVVIPCPLQAASRCAVGMNSFYQAYMERAAVGLKSARLNHYGLDLDSEPLPEIDWFGTIVDLQLDGNVVVKFEHSLGSQSISIPPERIVCVATIENNIIKSIDVERGDPEENADVEGEMHQSSVEELIMSAEQHYSEMHQVRASLRALLKRYEDQDGATDDSDETEMKESSESDLSLDDTEVEEVSESELYEGIPAEVDGIGTEASQDDNDVAEISRSEFLQDISAKSDAIRPNPTICIPQSWQTGEFCGLNYPSMPPRFRILENPAPPDHHFILWPKISSSTSMNFIRRVHKEHLIMQSSLPDSVFVRTWEDRMNLLRVLIVGPRETPYELAPFIIDLVLGADFPKSPPKAYFHSWTNGNGRINPNLYENGKICLSLLGTWDSHEKHEAWSENGSTILQVIVSLMGLVLVREPYYNEAGFDALVGMEDHRIASAHYTEKAFVLAKGFVKTALTAPPGDMREIIEWLYLSSWPGPNLLKIVIGESKALILRSKSSKYSAPLLADPDESSRFAARISSGALLWLQSMVGLLEQIVETH